MLNWFKEKLSGKGKSKYETLKSDIKNYLIPITSYFNYKKELNNEKISDDLKKGIKNLLDLTEKDCYENLEKIEKLLNKD